MLTLISVAGVLGVVAGGWLIGRGGVLNVAAGSHLIENGVAVLGAVVGAVLSGE